MDGTHHDWPVGIDSSNVAGVREDAPLSGMVTAFLARDAIW